MAIESQEERKEEEVGWLFLPKFYWMILYFSYDIAGIVREFQRLTRG
jgi:hypothetical protein